MYELTDKIPVPERTSKTFTSYPFRNMKVGDSFRVDDTLAHNVNIPYWKSKTGFQFITRTLTDDDGTKYIRVWRTA